MSDLIDDGPEGANTPEFSVSEISGAVKRMVEGEFGHVRVRGELGRVSRPRSGHIYLDLKDERSVLAGVVWKGAAAGLDIQPEEGMEVIATGRLTTFPGQSKYQIIIEALAPAGMGALMAMLEKRRKALAAEGLFDAERKRALPFLPRTIGVVTSPSGAVIRDILHRVAERFPVRVLVWPVAVQGQKCAPEVAAAIRGFSEATEDLRPDVLIIARGGGSVEDLWGFNEEVVVRATAECTIPVISAVGHETDTTLIDLAADRRAPTPSAAAEMAVPVRAELAAQIADLQARRLRAVEAHLERRRQRLSDLARALPRPGQLIEERRQRLDVLGAGLPRPRQLLSEPRQRLALSAQRLAPALRERTQNARTALGTRAGRFGPAQVRMRIGRGRDRLVPVGERLVPALTRLHADAEARLTALGRTLGAYSYKATLRRGFAVVRDQYRTVLDTAGSIAPGMTLDIELADGRRGATANAEFTPAGDRVPAKPRAAPVLKKRSPKPSKDDGQGSLF